MLKYTLFLSLLGCITSCTTAKPLVIWNDGLAVYQDFCNVNITKDCGVTIFNCNLFEGTTYCSNNVTIYDKITK